MIWILSWRNIWRNRSRTLITLLSVAFAVFLTIVMQSLQKGIFDHMINNVVRYYTGYVQIHQAGYWKERILENSFEWPGTLEKKISNIQGIQGWVPRLESFMLASSEMHTKGCFVIGTNPDLENRLTRLQTRLVAGSYLELHDKALLLGDELAHKLKIKPGDSLILLGQGMQGSLSAFKAPVKGILHFGSPDQNARFIYSSLPFLQTQLNAENFITSLSIDIPNENQMVMVQKKLLQNLDSSYECLNWRELLPDLNGHIEADKNSSSIFSGVLYFIITFGIFGTLMMMMAERQREFGIMMSLGMQKSFLSFTLFLEIMMVSLLGVACGMVMSIPITFYFQEHPIQLGGKIAEVYKEFGFEALLPMAVSPSIFIRQAVIVFGIASILSLYPMWHIKNLNPVKAFRSK